MSMIDMMNDQTGKRKPPTLDFSKLQMPESSVPKIDFGKIDAPKIDLFDTKAQDNLRQDLGAVGRQSRSEFSDAFGSSFNSLAGKNIYLDEPITQARDGGGTVATHKTGVGYLNLTQEGRDWLLKEAPNYLDPKTGHVPDEILIGKANEIRESVLERRGTASNDAGQLLGRLARFMGSYMAFGPSVEQAVSPAVHMATGAIASKALPLLKSATPYGTLSTQKGIEAANIILKEQTGRYLTKALPTLTVEALKDVFIGSPMYYTEATDQGLEGAEKAKFMGKEFLIDVLMNTVMYGGQTLMKYLIEGSEESKKLIIKELSQHFDEKTVRTVVGELEQAGYKVTNQSVALLDNPNILNKMRQSQVYETLMNSAKKVADTQKSIGDSVNFVKSKYGTVELNAKQLEEVKALFGIDFDAMNKELADAVSEFNNLRSTLNPENITRDMLEAKIKSGEFSILDERILKEADFNKRGFPTLEQLEAGKTPTDIYRGANITEELSGQQRFAGAPEQQATVRPQNVQEPQLGLRPKDAPLEGQRSFLDAKGEIDPAMKVDTQAPARASADIDTFRVESESMVEAYALDYKHTMMLSPDVASSQFSTAELDRIPTLTREYHRTLTKYEEIVATPFMREAQFNKATDAKAIDALISNHLIDGKPLPSVAGEYKAYQEALKAFETSGEGKEALQKAYMDFVNADTFAKSLNARKELAAHLQKYPENILKLRDPSGAINDFNINYDYAEDMLWKSVFTEDGAPLPRRNVKHIDAMIVMYENLGDADNVVANLKKLKKASSKLSAEGHEVFAELMDEIDLYHTLHPNKGQGLVDVLTKDFETLAKKVEVPATKAVPDLKAPETPVKAPEVPVKAEAPVEPKQLSFDDMEARTKVNQISQVQEQLVNGEIGTAEAMVRTNELVEGVKFEGDVKADPNTSFFHDHNAMLEAESPNLAQRRTVSRARYNAEPGSKYAEELRKIDATYNQLSNAQVSDMANYIVKNFPNEIQYAIQDTTRGFSNAVEGASAIKLINMLQEDAPEMAAQLLEMASKKFTKAGQVVQIANLWSGMSTRGLEGYLKNLENKYNFKFKGEDIAKWKGQWIQIQNLENKELQEMIINNFLNNKRKLVSGKRLKDIAVDNYKKALAEGREPTKAESQPMYSFFDKAKSEITGKELTNYIERTLLRSDNIELQSMLRFQLVGEMKDAIPKELGRQVSAIQAFSHLASLRTYNRNWLSNASFGFLEDISHLPGIMVDRLYTSKTNAFKVQNTRAVGSPVPILLGKDSSARRAARKVGGEMAQTRLALGIDAGKAGKYTLSNTGHAFSNTNLGGRLGRGMEDTVSKILQIPDARFQASASYAVERQLTLLAGLKAPTDEIKAIAAQEARFRTFHDDSLIAVLMGNMKDSLNALPIGLGDSGRRIGRAGQHKVRAMGMGDLVIKYTSVPGNIITRSIDYSPFGAMKALYNMSLVNSGAKEVSLATQREISMAFGRAFTGTSLIGLGALLHNGGFLVTPSATSSKSKRAMERTQGVAGMRLNLSAVGRLIDIRSGKETWESARELREDDMLITLSGMMEPLSKTLAIGSNLQNVMNQQRETDTKMGAVDYSKAVFNATWNEVLDMPTLWVIKSMTYQEGVADVMLTPVRQAIPGFVPAVLRQLSQFDSPSQKEVYSGDNQVSRQIQQNIPGLRRELEPRLSPIGTTYNETDNRVIDFINSFVSPGRITKFKDIPYMDFLTQLEKDSGGKTEHYPSDRPPNKVTVNKVDYPLNNEQRQLFQKVYGTELDKLLREQVPQLEARDLTAQQRLDHMRRLKIRASELARRAVQRELGLRGE